VKNKHRMFRSGKSGYYYWLDNDTGKQGTLGTLDKGEAQRLVNARNESCNTPATAKSPNCPRLPERCRPRTDHPHLAGGDGSPGRPQARD
jgi:hypothetical protein